MKNILQKNPSSNEFGLNSPVSPKVLKEAKTKNKERRKMKRIWEAKNFPDKFDTEMGTCWMCWMDLTNENLDGFRREPWSEMKKHEEICPLCGYPNWKGRVWFPFKFLRGYIGNPSARDGMK